MWLFCSSTCEKEPTEFILLKEGILKDFRRVILIVDDEASDRFLLERALCKTDSRLVVRAVSDGCQALAYLNGSGEYREREQFPFPTFIFIDLKMPMLDGFAVLEHLKKNPKWAVIPTIVLTGSSDLDDIKKSFLLGACAYHVKPPNNQAREKFCRLFLEYWGSSEVPQTDEAGNQLITNSEGKLGERFSQP
jgi:CheY-like chemotaxis protein